MANQPCLDQLKLNWWHLNECPAWFYAGTLHLELIWCYFHGVLGNLKTVLGEWACKEFLPGKAWTSFFLPFPLGSWSAIDCVLSPSHSTPPSLILTAESPFRCPTGSNDRTESRMLKHQNLPPPLKILFFSLKPLGLSSSPPWSKARNEFGLSLHLQGRLSFLWKWKQKLSWRGSTYWKMEREPWVSERNLLWFIFKCIALAFAFVEGMWHVASPLQFSVRKPVVGQE